MTLVFQYGSNISASRLNHENRLAGDAKPIGIAGTIELFDLGFTVWSKTNECAAADIAPSETGRNVFGVVYQIPDFLIYRESANRRNRKSLDAIEGEGGNYVREEIKLSKSDGTQIKALTYVVREKMEGLKTSFAYVQHILKGMKEFQFPNEYREYVVSCIVSNNAELESKIVEYQQGA